MKIIWSQPEPGPMWCVRGMAQSEDLSIVIEAPSKAEAELAGWRRGIQVVIVSPATADDIADAKAQNLLYRYSPPPRLQCFGNPVPYSRVACLVLCACATIVLDLHAWHVPMHF